MSWNHHLFYMLQHKPHAIIQAHIGNAKERRQKFLYISASLFSNETANYKDYIRKVSLLHTSKLLP